MNSFKLLMSLFFTVCWFREYFGADFKNILSDNDYITKLEEADKIDQWNVLCYVDNTNEYDSLLSVLASTYPNTIFFKVDLSICKNTGIHINEEGQPKIVLRKLAINKDTFISSELSEIKNKLNANNVHPLEDDNVQNSEGTNNNSKGIGNLKNGSSSFDNLQGCPLTGLFMLSNTCAFDSLSTILMVAYYDSNKYKQKIDTNNNEFFGFISETANNGITDKTYCDRIDIIIKKTKPKIEHVENVQFIECRTTITTVISLLLIDFPTIRKKRITSSTMELITIEPKAYVTYETQDRNLNKLQDYLNASFEPEIVNEDTISSDISDMHLFIDTFYWNSEDIDQNATDNSETTEHVEAQLSEIPKSLTFNSISYVLRGVIGFEPGNTKTRFSTGHYIAYVFKEADIWYMYNDVKTSSETINQNTNISIELLVYTI